jgi:predicted metal-binding membrane protein
VRRPLADGASAVWIWEVALVGALLGLSALAWLVTGQLSTPDMRHGLLTGAGSTMSMSSTGAGSLPLVGLFLLTWVVMMVAMMFPAVSPVVVTFDRWVRRTRPSRWASVLFVGGYLVVWTVSGLVIYAVVVYVQPLLPSGEGALRWGGGLLVLAGGYQLTPLKAVCLRHCRSPLAFVAQHAMQLRGGGLGAARVGVIHGAYCLGCCWALMLVLALLGMMNLAWMAGVAAVIFLEKVLPRGPLVAQAVAVLLIAVGSALLVSPHSLPPLI